MSEATLNAQRQRPTLNPEEEGEATRFWELNGPRVVCGALGPIAGV